MKKTSKIIMSMLLSAVLICGTFMSAFAADSGTLYAVTDAVCENLGNPNPQTGKGESQSFGIMGLGPVDNGDGTFSDAKIAFTINVETAGIYTIKVHHAAKQGEGQQRKADIIINGERSALDVTANADWITYTDAVVEAHLNAGDNSVVFVNDANFDNVTIKSINIDYITYELKTADSVEDETTAGAAEDETTAGAAEDETTAGAAEDETTAGADEDETTVQEEKPSVSTGDIADVLPLMFIGCACAAMVVFSKKTICNEN